MASLRITGLLILAAQLCARTHADAPFTSAQVQTMTSFFTANIDIQGSGAVVASPDHDTPGGSYYFHWARDGALSMNALQQIAGDDAVASYGSQFSDYINWVVRMQGETDPNNVDVRVEAKFSIPDGAPYTGAWCRPQTDGPGLRAITLVTYANALVTAGKTNEVKQFLWTGGSSFNGGAIKHDLEWVTQNWDSSGCDLWEEVKSTDFFWNRITMHKALTIGATFAQSMGDAASAKLYSDTANKVGATLGRHYNGQFVFEEDNRQKDAAVICAFNDGYVSGGQFAPAGKEVAGTISTYNDLFHGMFPINSADDANNIPGILYGRYEGDTYAGGNPWILTTGCLAELFYRAASEVDSNNALPAEEALHHWNKVLGGDPAQTAQGLARQMAMTADGILTRIKYHTVGDGLHMPEQLDKTTGYEASATDLTWSYATVLKAMTARASVAHLVDKQSSLEAAAPTAAPTKANAAGVVVGSVVGIALVAIVVVMVARWRSTSRTGYAQVA